MLFGTWSEESALVWIESLRQEPGVDSDVLLCAYLVARRQLDRATRAKRHWSDASIASLCGVPEWQVARRNYETRPCQAFGGLIDRH
jgi:hypothetical protein